MRLGLSLLAGLTLACAVPVVAQPSFEDERKCWDSGEEFSPEEQIAGCNALLEADGLLEEDRPYVIAMRGWSYHELGDLERALADYAEKVRLQPDVGDGYGWRGAVYLDQSDYAHALEDYSTAIRLEPEATDVPVWYHDRGVVRHEQGDYASAVADFTKAINLAPDYAANWNSRCWARAVWGRQLVEALDDCNEALALDPISYDTYDSRGLVHLRHEEWDEALADYGASLDIETTASAYYGRGVALSRLGQARDAEANYVMATRLDPEIAEIYAGFGITP